MEKEELTEHVRLLVAEVAELKRRINGFESALSDLRVRDLLVAYDAKCDGHDVASKSMMSKPELASRWDVSQSTIEKAIKSGEIKSVKVNGTTTRIPLSEVLRRESTVVSNETPG